MSSSPKPVQLPLKSTSTRFGPTLNSKLSKSVPSPKSRSPLNLSKSRSKKSPQKNEYSKFIEDVITISINMLEDKNFEENAEDYKQWLLSPGSLQNNKSYTKVCENIVEQILEIMYQFHTKIKTDRAKTKEQALIIYVIANVLVAATVAYPILDPLINSYGITPNIIIPSTIITILGSTLTGLLFENYFYNNKKISKKDTEEVLKIKELFEEYLECVLSI